MEFKIGDKVICIKPEYDFHANLNISEYTITNIEYRTIGIVLKIRHEKYKYNNQKWPIEDLAFVHQRFIKSTPLLRAIYGI